MINNMKYTGVTTTIDLLRRSKDRKIYYNLKDNQFYIRLKKNEMKIVNIENIHLSCKEIELNYHRSKCILKLKTFVREQKIKNIIGE